MGGTSAGKHHLRATDRRQSSPTTLTLAPLGYYGGPTETMPPLPGSLAFGGQTATTGIRCSFQPFVPYVRGVRGRRNRSPEAATTRRSLNAPGPDRRSARRLPQHRWHRGFIGAPSKSAPGADAFGGRAHSGTRPHPSRCRPELQFRGSMTSLGGRSINPRRPAPYSTPSVTCNSNLAAGAFSLHRYQCEFRPPTFFTLCDQWTSGAPSHLTGEFLSVNRYPQGNVVVTGMTLTTATDAPTILAHRWQLGAAQ